MMRLSITMTLLIALACPALADSDVEVPSVLRLRSQALARDADVTFADVLDLSGVPTEIAEAIRDLAVVETVAPGVPVQITHDKIVTLLDEAGVNLGQVLVVGAYTCEVTVLAPEPDEKNAARPVPAAPLVRENGTGGSHSLAELLRARLHDEFASMGGAIEVQFDLASREFLALTSPPFSFDVRTTRSGTLGLREFHISIRRDGRLQRVVPITGRVQLVKQVVVADGPLNVGSTIKREQLTSAERIFGDLKDVGLDDMDRLIGQRVRRFVPAGQMVTSADVQDAALVQRLRPITIVSTGDVQVRLNGTALESGGYGETIRVRLGDSRKSRREIRAVITGVGEARMLDES